MSETRLTGCGTALATPFTTGGAIDERALRALGYCKIHAGIDYLVPCVTTGAAATLTAADPRRVVEITVEQVRERVPVVAGAASNDTARAVALSKEMEAAGATHLLHSSPMYNKPPQRGIVAHFHAIADAVRIPTVVYNVPGRTASNVEAGTTLELAKHPRIAAVKEASGLLPQITDIIVGRPEGFSVLSGDDELTLPILVLGGDGLVSVISNVAPRLTAEMVRLALSGRFEKARDIHQRLLPWMRAAFIESNPVPVKAALNMLGRMDNRLRLPLVPLAESRSAAVREALERAGVL
jgi:4-hydroxy-tetrahydrodipicolinate synthase